ncbi:Omp28-related outer membrane protein [candidate division TA06 bacterium]|uniref:Omp28-related outer membrane protein n=1 Tax=candidate division TA06 bacterium TaxID=2250710 RepID=A0A523UUQ2_UNCT6|nr:MAG: Omp28-related outer membrane protein [candidate division TA06 bacterium]
MRRVMFVLLLLGLTGAALNAHATTRMVLGEMFTNWGCPPCRPANDELDRFAPLHPNLAVIRYHTWWPSGSDPFYLDNAGENTVRTNYYQPGTKSVPWFLIDGLIVAGSNYSSYEALVTGREAVESPLDITIDGTYSSGTRSGTVTAYIEATDVINLTNLKLHFALTESEIYLSAPNGQTVFHEAMRDMLPNANGESINISSPGDTIMRSRDFTLDSTWVLQNCEIVVFVQSDNTKEVLQGAKWKIPIDVPNLAYIENLIVDSLGNGDGRADPDEAVDMIITLENDPIFQDATNVTATLSCDDPDVNITQGTVNYPDIPAGSVADNSSDPFKFSVDAAAQPHRAYFDLHVTADPGGYSMDYRFWIMLGRPDVLLVDDDNGTVFEIFFEPVLDSLHVAYDKWDIHYDVSSPALPLYHCVIWFTGDDSVATLTAQDQADLAAFLDGGGGLILTGQSIGEDISGTPFYSNYLHAGLVKPVTNDHILDGETGDPIGDGISLITAGSGGAGNQTSQDVIEPVGGASTVFNYSPDSAAAIRYDSGTYRVVYYAFGLEGLNKISIYSGRDTVLARSLEWVGCPIPVGLEEESIHQVRPTDHMALNCSPNPFRGLVGISAVPSPYESEITISVYDIAGRLVSRLFDGRPLDGHMPIVTEWDGMDYNGGEAGSGVYFVKLTCGALSKTEKVVLLR